MARPRPLTSIAWQAERRRARRHLGLWAGLLVLGGVGLAVGGRALLAWLTGPEKGLLMVAFGSAFFALIWQVERLLELRPLPPEERPALVALEGEARVAAREGEVPLLRMDALDLAQERWRATPVYAPK
jgi:hypothetical protein